jgi:hypothetical protein
MNGVHGPHKIDQARTCKNQAIVLGVRTFEAAPVEAPRCVELRASAATARLGRDAA